MYSLVTQFFFYLSGVSFLVFMLAIFCSWLRMLKGKDDEWNSCPKMLPHRFIIPLDLDNSAKIGEQIVLLVCYLIYSGFVFS